MSRKLLGFVLVVSVAVNIAAVFALATYWREAQRPQPGPAQDRPAPMEVSDLQTRYGLTDVQMDTMKALRKYRRDNVRPVRDRLDQMQADMLKSLQESDVSQSRVDSLMRGIVAAQETLEIRSLEVLERMRNVLTAEQRSRLPELFRDLQRAGRRPGKGRRPGQGKGPGKGPRPGEGEETPSGDPPAGGPPGR